MFPSFIGILDIQSWWEVPSIAYFCSLFRTAFNLLDFDIEELEEALLTDGTEDSASSLLTELIVRLLNGCLGNNDISAFNYQMYLRRLFRQKCQETGRYNPFNTDIDFQFLPLRTKVEILYALCDFRLDADDVFDLFKNLEAESLRVEPLGWDGNHSAYWYFYGTRLYREDVVKKPKGKNKKRKGRESKKLGWFYGDDWLDDEDTERVWQVVCFTEEDWAHLTEKFSKATSKVEKELYRSLSQNFLPEIPRLFQEKERLQRKRLLELAPRRTSSRVLQKIKQKEEENKPSDTETDKKDQEDDKKEQVDLARENRAKRRNLLRLKSDSSDSSESIEMPQKATKRLKGQDKRSKNSSATHKGEPPPEIPVKPGRKTNNSLASATGQILIPENVEPVNSTRKKLKTSQIFSQTEEDIQTDMYKVLEQLTAHEDAWPFMDPVEEEYAPNYYAVIRRPMDLHKMEERLDSGYYTDFSMFKADFKLIVNNCRLYNGQDNEYTVMVDNLQAAFDRLTEKYIHRISSSDEEIAVEYQIPTPSRKHKLKNTESLPSHKKKKMKYHSDAGEERKANSDQGQLEEPQEQTIVKESKESRHKSKDGRIKKKRKGHHRHGKHSKNHQKDPHRKSKHSSKHSKKQKHGKDRTSKKSKKKKNKHSHETEKTETLVRTASQESIESSNRSRSASPLPSIHTPSPSPTEASPPEPLSDPDFFKDKYDKIKERRRHAAKDAWESLFDYKQKAIDKQKQNLNIPEKDKNQKLRETIEKLKAKNEKYKETTLFKNLYSPGKSGTAKKNDCPKASKKKDFDNDVEAEDDVVEVSKEKQNKHGSKKSKKNMSAKNESASEALEQAVKDISKWLDDAPKNSCTSSPCDSPAQTISTEEQDNSRLDDEFGHVDKSLHSKKEISRKRPSSREPKAIKRREIQRTIDRLQPGKSKGNLLTNISSKIVEKVEEITPLGNHNKVRETNKVDECSPKLSLGSVLATVEFTLGKDHNFDNNDEREKVDAPTESATVIIEKCVEKEETPTEVKPVETIIESKTETKVDPEPLITKPSQEKATPNLSAWFKAFGTPKSTTTIASVKKKIDDGDNEEKPSDSTKEENKSSSPKNPPKYDSPTDPDTSIPDGGDSPLPNVSNTPRQRRTSTGSSVSERSSFSQDLDSPRHQIAHSSPLLRSPASPRTDDFQKITYPIINGTVRAGFYQDTTSMKSSPEKSCSPREGPQSPYSPYSQHVYASNNVMGSSTPNYFVDHNKSPLPTYGQNQPPPYYDTTKASVVGKPRVHEDYTSLGPDTYPPNQYAGPYSPVQSPFSQSQTSTYSLPQQTPQKSNETSPVLTGTSQNLTDPKNTLFPVKKRTYNETEINKLHETKDDANTNQTRNDYQKIVQSIQSLSAIPSTSVDEIAAALSEKSDLAKLSSLREKSSVDYMERIALENRDKAGVIHNENHKNKDIAHLDGNKPIGMTKNDNIDMINMGYMNPENDRRLSGDHNDQHSFLINREVSRSNVYSDQHVFPINRDVSKLGSHSDLLNFPLNRDISKTTTHNDQHSFSMSREVGDLHNFPMNREGIKTSVHSEPHSFPINREVIKTSIHNDQHTFPLNREVLKSSSHSDQRFPVNREASKTRISNDHHGYSINRDTSKTSSHNDQHGFSKTSVNTPPKGFEIDAIAMNLGMNCLNQQKTITKSNVNSSPIPPAHAHERSATDINLNQHLLQQHAEYESINSTGQTPSNFSLSDIELANKKLYSCNAVPSNTAIDYGNWKMTNPVRKQDAVPSDYTTTYNASSSEKIKADVNTTNSVAINYNKNMQHQQYHNYNSPKTSLQNMQSELRIPNPRGLIKGDHTSASSMTSINVVSKNVELTAKSQKSDKNIQNHPLVSSLQFKTPYSTHSALPLESLRNLPNIPQMIERYSSDDRYLSSFAAASTASLYHDKTFQMAQMSQMFNKSISSDMHTSSPSVSAYSQPVITMTKDSGVYKTSSNLQNTQIEGKAKHKRKRTADMKQSSQILSNQSFHSSPCTTDVLSSVKTSMVPGSAFNFGASGNMALGGALYGDNSGFSIEEFRNSTSQLMAANYMAAAVAHQRSSVEAASAAGSGGGDKLKPAHQAGGTFPFLGGGSSGYADYQQYLQRHQHELLRHTGAQIMGLYPPGYPAALAARQPYDAINRPSWL